MKKVIVFVMTMIVLVCADLAQGGVSLVVNSSFENDGSIGDITQKAPYRWCDVSVPIGKFSGWVSNATDWVKHRNYYLILKSRPYVTFAVNDKATVSQDVYLTDVNEIIFNVRLDTTYNDPWDPAQRSAVLLIDGDVVWESNSVGSDVRGSYYDQIYTVDAQYKDANSHTLSVGIKANAAGYTYIEYRAKWDLVRFDTHCGGFGYLPGDFDRNCYVDVFDLEALTGQWLDEDPNYKYDVCQDGWYTVDFFDYAVFADDWMLNSDSDNWWMASCKQAELLSSDLNDDGIVNMLDYAILTGNWQQVGDCIRGDIDRSKIVDSADLDIFIDEWLSRSWIYSGIKE
jgi:hypothetical protein